MLANVNPTWLSKQSQAVPLYSLHLCPSSPHLKHSTTAISCLLIVLSSTLHCITLLFSTSNLFWGMAILFSPSFLFLQLQARCLNPLQFQHSLFLFPSNFALCHKLHSVISPPILQRFPWSQSQLKALKKTF